MKTKYVLPIVLVLLVGISILVSARMTFITEDDGLYNIYESEIILEEGWNLVSFGMELKSDSEIQESDIKAIFYYNLFDKEYIQYFPENPEFNELINQNSCGDGSCSVEERTDYPSWCSQDCYYNFNEDIVSHLNIISEKNVLLANGEKTTINFINNADMEVYFDEDYNGNGLDLYHNTVGGGGGSMGICRGFDEEINLLRTYGEDESKIYVKVDCSTDKKSFTFYEIDDEKVNPNELSVPSFEAKIISQPAWVYSNKRGLLKMEDISIKLSKNELQAGWNFVTITTEFDGYSLKQMKGNCDVLKIYMYDAENQEWFNLINYLEDDSWVYGEASEQGQGLVVKVSGSCYMGASGSTTTPPELP